MITNISLVTLWVNDQDAAKRFYLDKLGFIEHTNVRIGDGFRGSRSSIPITAGWR